MPLEFALRPRFDLERPAPQQKRRRLRIPPLALFMPAYWLAIAGVTKLLLRSAAEEPMVSHPGDATTQAAEIAAQPSPTSTPSGAVSAWSSTLAIPPEPSMEPVASMPVAPEPARPLERPLEPSPPARQLAAPRVSEQATPPLHVDRPAPTRPRGIDEMPAKRELEKAAVAREPEPSVTRAPERPVAREPERNEARGAALPGCESAAASANQSMDLRAAPGAPDLSREAFAAILDNGAYLAPCAIPSRTALEICVAVQNGKAVGVSVSSEPRDANVIACVRRAVAALRFPQSDRLDVTRTRFAAAR